MVILHFPKRQALAAVAVKLPRSACDVAQTSFRKYGGNAHYALSPGRGCDFDDARGCGGYDGAATFGLQRGVSFTAVRRNMPFYRGEDTIREMRAVTLRTHGPPHSVDNVGVRLRRLRGTCCFAEVMLLTCFRRLFFLFLHSS